MKHTHGLAIPTTLQDACHPQRMALLVYDMQVGICSQVKTANQVVTRISGLLAVARSKGMRVAFTRHLSLPTTWMGSMQYRTAMAWQGKDKPDGVAPWFLRDAPGFQIVSELAPRPEDAAFDKITMSAFERTPLAIALRDCGIPERRSTECPRGVARTTLGARTPRLAAVGYCCRAHLTSSSREACYAWNWRTRRCRNALYRKGSCRRSKGSTGNLRSPQRGTCTLPKAVSRRWVQVTH